MSDNLKFLLRVSGKERFKLYFSAILSIAGTLAGIAPYLLLHQLLIALLSTSTNLSQVNQLIIGVAALIILRLFLVIASGTLSHVAAFNILYQLRLKAVSHMATFPMGFFTNSTLGSVKKNIHEDIEKLENFIAHQVPDIASAIVTPIIIIAYLFHLDWQLTFLMLIPLILAIVVQMKMFKGMASWMERYHLLASDLNTTIVQYINGMPVMKAFNLSANSYESYTNSTKAYADFWEEMTHQVSPYYSTFLVIIDSGLLFIIPAGGILFLNGTLDAPTFILFLLLSTVFLNAFKSLLFFGNTFSMLLEGAGKIREILEAPYQNQGTLTFEQKMNKGIVFDHVTFKYDENTVINHLSLTIPLGTTTALVGPSGSGKTTLGQLLGRFWDVQEGTISIDGHDIRNYTFNSLYQQIAFVFQHPFILHDTILENVCLGKKYEFNTVVDACKKAQIHERILDLPEGYHTHLGESGIKLSGGEKQRLAIARAILKDCPIVILDEVTAYADLENESKIQMALDNLLIGRTVIMIAHRLYTIQHADKIVVLDKGQITEEGTHNELMMRNGLYKQLWDRSTQSTIRVKGA